MRYCCSDRSLHAGVRTCQTMAAATLGRQSPCFSDPPPHTPACRCSYVYFKFICSPVFLSLSYVSPVPVCSHVTGHMTAVSPGGGEGRYCDATLCTVACWGCLLHSQLYVTDYCAVSNSLMLVSNFHEHHWNATTSRIIVSVALQLS